MNPLLLALGILVGGAGDLIAGPAGYDGLGISAPAARRDQIHLRPANGVSALGALEAVGTRPEDAQWMPPSVAVPAEQTLSRPIAFSVTPDGVFDAAVPTGLSSEPDVVQVPIPPSLIIGFVGLAGMTGVLIRSRAQPLRVW